MNKLGAAPRRREVASDRPQRRERQPGLFLTFTVSHFLGHFSLVDQPGNQLDQPGRVSLAQGADAELLDQYHFITLRVVGQHTDCIMSYKHLTTDLATHASGKEFVSQMHPIKLVKTLITVLALYDLDGAWPGLGDVSHCKPLAGEFHRGRTLGIAHPNAPETADAASFLTRG